MHTKPHFCENCFYQTIIGVKWRSFCQVRKEKGFVRRIFGENPILRQLFRKDTDYGQTTLALPQTEKRRQFV